MVNNDFEDESFLLFDFILKKYGVNSIAEMTDEQLIEQSDILEILIYIREFAQKLPDVKIEDKINWKFKTNNWFELNYEQANQVLYGLYNKYN